MASGTRFRSRSLGFLGTVAVVGAFIACKPDVTQPWEISSIDGMPLDANRMHELRAQGEGCGVSTQPTEGTRRGIAILREQLPFRAPAIRRGPGQRPDGRAATIKITRSNGAPVVMDCWLPSSMTASQLNEILKGSSSGRWADMLSRVDAAPPLSAVRSLSREMLQFRTEMLVPAKSSITATRNCEYEMGASTSGEVAGEAPCPGDDGGCTTLIIRLRGGETEDGQGVWNIDVMITWCDDSGGGGGGEVYCASFDCLDDVQPPATFDCSGTWSPNEKDALRQQYIDSSLHYIPACSDLLYQPTIGALWDYNIVQYHAILTEYDPHSSYALLRGTIWVGLINLYSDTAYLITTANRIYSTPHHNNLVRCYQSPTYTAPKLDAQGNPLCRPGNMVLGLNSRHVYGDAADIHVPDFANWDNLRAKAQARTPRPCAEPYEWSPSHLHLDWRTEANAFDKWPGCGSLI